MVAPRGGGSSSRWPSEEELDIVRKKVVEISGRDAKEVRVVACPYRICPLGAHIDHQGGTVTAMTINYGVLLGFVPSDDAEVLLQSGQFEGVIRFRVDDLQKPIDDPENINWVSYASGAVYALQNGGYDLTKGIIGYISGVKGLDSSGLSSSAAVGIAYLLALENVNELVVSPVDNIQLDKAIENKYLGLENGILDPSAILLSRYGYLTFMDCKEEGEVLSVVVLGTWSQRASPCSVLDHLRPRDVAIIWHRVYSSRCNQADASIQTASSGRQKGRS